MRKLLNKKGQLGGLVNLPGSVMIGLLVLVITAIACFLALSILQTSSLFPTASAGANSTNSIINLTVGGAMQFFNVVPTLFSVLGVVLILGAIGLLLFVIYRFAKGGGGGGI